MRKYRVLEKLGEGSFASVHKCTYRQQFCNGGDAEAIVAIKLLKQRFENWDDCKRLREVRSLAKLKHKNIIKCTEVILEKNQELYLVFEYAPRNLWQVIKSKHEHLGLARIKRILYGTLDGLAYMHKHGFFHRDIKPENILLRIENDDEVVKIADFGCARAIRYRPPYTDYIATRWYRAPELLLYQSMYSSPVDLWAAGCILCELFLRKNIFAGESDMDMLHLIFSKLGSIKNENWLQGTALSRIAKFPQYAGVPFNKLFKGTELEDNAHGKQLVQQLLTYNPKKRITAQLALQHRFFLDPTLDPGNSQQGHDGARRSMTAAYTRDQVTQDQIDGLFHEGPMESKHDPLKLRPEEKSQQLCETHDADIDKMLQEIKFDCSEVDVESISTSKVTSMENTFGSDESFEEYLERITGSCAEEAKNDSCKRAENDQEHEQKIHAEKETHCPLQDSSDFESFLDDIIHNKS